MLAKCEEDEDLAQRFKELFRRDILTWIDLCCWTKDQRRQQQPTLPFICYDYQRKYILEVKKAIEEGYDLLTEKSRDMGVSWIILYVYTHMWLFEKRIRF